MRRPLETMKFHEMKDKTFKVIQVIENLCELCGKPLYEKEGKVKTVQISSHNDYSNLLLRARAHDRVEVDSEKNEIYLYDHDYPGDVHPNCIENYSKT